MRYVFFSIFILLNFSFCNAQSSDLRASLSLVNQTLRQFMIGTEEFKPYYMAECRDRFEYKTIAFSFDYPNIVFDYKIGGRVKYPGWHREVKEGTYKVVIPLESLIEYPVEYMSMGERRYSYSTLKITNNSGITKTTNGKSSIITSFSIYGDEDLTMKRFGEELKKFVSLLKSENYQGKLGGSQRNSARTSRQNSQQQTKTSKNVGKYVQ